MESLNEMRDYIMTHKESTSFVNNVYTVYINSIIHRLTIFMDRPICVSMISDAIMHNAKTFMLVEQDCHIYWNILCWNKFSPTHMCWGLKGCNEYGGSFQWT